jgi:hypothetical protein
MIDRLRTLSVICLTLLLAPGVAMLALAEPAAAQPQPLPTPQLLMPADKALAKGTAFTQSWSAVDGAHYYEYESYYDAAKTKLRARQKADGPSKTIAQVPDGTFWWRVRAVAVGGVRSPWSIARQTTTDSTAPTIRPLRTIGSAPVQGTVHFVFESIDKHPYRITSGVFSEVPRGGLPVDDPAQGDGNVVQAAEVDVRATVTLNINTLSMPNGQQTIIINAEDRVGNVHEQRFNFTVANPAPVNPVTPQAGTAAPPAPKLTQTVRRSDAAPSTDRSRTRADDVQARAGVAVKAASHETDRVLGVSTGRGAASSNPESKGGSEGSKGIQAYWIAGGVLCALAAGIVRLRQKRSAV